MKKKISELSATLFFIFPPIGFVLSLINLRSKYSAFVYIATATIFGYAFSLTNHSADSYRYAIAFENFDNSLTYDSIIRLYRNGELRDMYRLLLYYFASLFSSNAKVMFAFAGMFYGIFSYLNMKIFVIEKGSKLNLYTFILGLCFFVYCSFSNINGLRFTTGSMVLFYSVYNFIILRKKVAVIGILVLPLFHYGFILAVPLLILYSFFESFFYDKNKDILISFFIISFLLSWILGTNAINLGFLSKSGVVSGEIGSRLEYLNSDSITSLVERRASNSLFLTVQKYFDIGIRIYVFVMILYLNPLIKKNINDKIMYQRIFNFILFFYSFSFIAISFPSGERFLYIAHMFLFLFMVKFYKVYHNETFKKLILLSIPVFSFNIIFIVVFLPIIILSPIFWYGNVIWIIGDGLNFNLLNN